MGKSRASAEVSIVRAELTISCVFAQIKSKAESLFDTRGYIAKHTVEIKSGSMSVWKILSRGGVLFCVV